MSKNLDGIILIALLIFIVAAIAACSAWPGDKAIVHPNVPQAPEQCDAQPDLAWCQPHG